MQLAAVITITGLALVALVWYLHLKLRGAVQPAAAGVPLAGYPPLTVIRPIRGLDVGARENLRAALDHGYPGRVTTYFVFDDEDEPAIPLARELIAERRAAGDEVVADIVICGPPPEGRTGKINAMMAGLRLTTTERVVFADSDIRPDRGALRALVEALERAPDAGAAFVPVHSSEPPTTVGDVGYALLLNGLYGPAAALAARRRGGELPFIMGQLMLLRRSALQSIGGVESADGQLVDDMYLGQRLALAGFRNLVVPHPVPVIQHGSGLREFLGVYVRWITFSRTGLPEPSFKAIPALHGVACWVGAILAVVGLASGHLAAAAIAALAPISVAMSINELHRVVGGTALRLRFSWVAIALLLVAPVVLARTLYARQVIWRGRSYDLDAGAHLAAPAPAAVPAPIPTRGPAPHRL
jgi:ceramide glucosyltransferase